jgi:hypothetical protein
VQQLLRHASTMVTLDVYAQALTPAKRAAQRKVVMMIPENLTVPGVYRGQPRARNLLIRFGVPGRDLNPCYRRERALTGWITLLLQESGRSAMPCKERLDTLRRIYCLHRSCTASFDRGSLNWSSVALENEPQA